LVGAASGASVLSGGWSCSGIPPPKPGRASFRSPSSFSSAAGETAGAHPRDSVLLVLAVLLPAFEILRSGTP
jgi:hypothetical protein